MCMGVFSLGGFDPRGRAYTSRYKAVVISQAVLVAYTLFAAIALAANRRNDFLIWPLACGINVGLLLATRVWSTVWRQLVRAESRFGVRPPRRIRNVLIIGGA